MVRIFRKRFFPLCFSPLILAACDRSPPPPAPAAAGAAVGAAPAAAAGSTPAISTPAATTPAPATPLQAAQLFTAMLATGNIEHAIDQFWDLDAALALIYPDQALSFDEESRSRCTFALYYLLLHSYRAAMWDDPNALMANQAQTWTFSDFTVLAPGHPSFPALSYPTTDLALVSYTCSTGTPPRIHRQTMILRSTASGIKIIDLINTPRFTFTGQLQKLSEDAGLPPADFLPAYAGAVREYR